MLSFLRFGKDAFPLLNPRALDAWFQQQPTNNVIGLQEESVGLLKSLPTVQRPPDQNRLDALYLLDERLTELRNALTTQYVASARANTSLESRLWSAGYDLVVAFINAYEYLLKEGPRHLSERKWDQNLPALLGRLIYYRGLDAKFRLFRHEAWIPGRWHELHANYTLACARGVQSVPLPLANVEAASRGVTIEQQYLHLLLLQLVNTGNVRPPQIEWVANQIPGWAKDLVLTTTPKLNGGFCVDLASNEGLERKRDPQGGQFLYLDTTVLHTRMLQHAMAIKDELETATGEKRRAFEEQFDALGKLTSCYAPVFKPFARSADRAQHSSESRVAFGFKGICKMLAEIEDEKAHAAKASESYSYSETAAMYVYGFLSEEVNKRREREKKLFSPPAKLYGEPAQILDRSATGCRLAVAANLVGPSELGTLVAMRQDDASPWSVGIVRRIRKMTADQVEVGVQLIAPAMARVSLRSQRQVKDTLAGYSVNGVHAMAHGDRVDGLCLEPLTGSEQASGMSVILPTAEYRSAQQMTLQDGPEAFNIMLRQAFERQTEWTWASADVLGGALD